MKHKKMTALALALSVLLVCGVTAGFATEPVDNFDEPVLTDTKPAESEPAPVETAPVETESAEIEPVETEPVETDLVPAETGFAEGCIVILDINEARLLSEEIIEALSVLYGTEIEVISADTVAVQSDCTHPNLEQGSPVRLYLYSHGDQSGHIIRLMTGYTCPNCYKDILTDSSMMTEGHTFGPGTYVSANHSAANPAQHFYVYTHTCEFCGYSCEYTTPIGCTVAGCIIPEVMSTGDGET